MSDRSLESLEILGVSVFDRPPIGTLHLPLQPGLHILYGKNGAGKTRTLEAVRGALANAVELETGAWVHMRVVDEALPGVLLADDYFREPLFFELSDSLLRSLHYEDEEDEMGGRVMDYIAGWGGSQVPDSIQGLVTAIASVQAVDEIEPAAQEIHGSCYLSVELKSGRARVFLSSMNESTPILTALGRIAVALSRGPIDEGWDAKSARQFQPPSAPTDLDDADIARMVSEDLVDQVAGDRDNTDVIKKLVRAAAALNPRFEYFHRDRPHWVPTPVMTLCGGLEASILGVWEDRRQVNPTELAQLTLDALDTSGEESVFEEASDGDATGITATSEVKARLAQLGDLASDRFAALLKDAPPIEPVLLSPKSWLYGRVLEWSAYDVDADLRPVELGRLSEAQQRWAAASIRQTLDHPSTPTHLILDEPEHALHATATKHLAQGLAELADSSGLLVLVASHAPGMLSYPGASLLHVHRDQFGEVQLSRLSPSETSRMSEAADGLGLTTSDLLQLTRVFLYVEGEHDKAVLNELFGSDFDSAGVRILTMGGARKLATVTDSRFLFDYTNADVMVVVDNVDGPEFAEAWELAKQEVAAGKNDKARALLDRAKGAGSEWEHLRMFANAAIDHGGVERLHVYGLSQPDIIYYLPSDDFVSGSSWEELSSAYFKERKPIAGGVEGIKPWLKRRHGVNVTTKKMTSAARLVDEPHDDLWRVMRYATSLALPRRERRRS